MSTVCFVSFVFGCIKDILVYFTCLTLIFGLPSKLGFCLAL